MELRHRSFYEDADVEAALLRILEDAGVEWIDLDTTTLFASDTPSEAERSARRQKPRLPRRIDALTDHPIVRFVGRDDLGQTRAGWQPLIPIVAGWLGERRTPTVFVHTPDNIHALALARRFYDDVRSVVSELEPVPEPARPDPPPEPTLF